MIEQIKALSESRWYPATQRFLVSDALGVESIYDCENGKLHQLKDGRIVEELEATPERLAAILASLGPTSEELIERLKEVRDSRVKGGCAFGPLRIQTDTEAIANLNGKYARASYMASAGQDYSFEWSLGGGKSVKLGLPEIVQIGAVIDQYIQKCYDRYLALYKRIEAGEDLGKIEADLETDWPE